MNLKRLLNAITPVLEVREESERWQIFKRLGQFSWKARNTGPFGMDIPWLYKDFAEGKMKAMEKEEDYEY